MNKIKCVQLICFKFKTVLNELWVTTRSAVLLPPSVSISRHNDAMFVIIW